MIAIVDYQSGNLAAIGNIYKQLKIPHVITRDRDTMNDADKYVLPGVGHFGQAMSVIRHSGLFDTLSENVLAKGKPLLGICVGMQLLADASDESSEPGLGWIPGRVRKIQPNSQATRLPHMGWNSISLRQDASGLFDGVDVQQGFYFLHNYHFVPQSPAHILATTNYGDALTCGVSNGKNIFGLQFHPEKSHRNGVTVFRNFARI